MNTCDTCRHWDAPKEELLPHWKDPGPWATMFGQCLNPRLADSDGKGMTKVHEHTGDPSNAVPDATDDDMLSFDTGPKFGCIHYEAKEGE